MEVLRCFMSVSKKGVRPRDSVLEPSRAAQSSSLGTEMVLIGATRVLEQSMCEWKPSAIIETMYATLAYADSEASQTNVQFCCFKIFAKNVSRNFQDIQITKRFAKHQPQFYQRFGKQIVPIEF